MHTCHFTLLIFMEIKYISTNAPIQFPINSYWIKWIEDILNDYKDKKLFFSDMLLFEQMLHYSCGQSHGPWCMMAHGQPEGFLSDAIKWRNGERMQLITYTRLHPSIHQSLSLRHSLSSFDQLPFCQYHPSPLTYMTDKQHYVLVTASVCIIGDRLMLGSICSK